MSLVRHGNSENHYYRFNYKGKTYFGSTGTSNKTLAARIEEKKKREVIEAVELGVTESITVQQAIDKYLSTKKQKSEFRNLQTYAKKLLGKKMNNKTKKDDNVFGLVGVQKFESLTTADIQRLVLARREEGNGNAAILHELVLLSQTIKLIKRLGLSAPTIDFASVKRESEVRPSGGRVRFLSKEEEDALLAQLDPDNELKPFGNDSRAHVRTQRQDTYDLVIALLDTGARYNEIAKLPWDRVNLKKRQINIRRTKTNNESYLAISDRLFEVLKRRAATKRPDQAYVFEDSNGSSRNYANRAFVAACKRANIKDCSYHTLRHTFASRLCQNGLPLYELSLLLGHADIKTTQIYAHLVPSQSASRAVEIINRINALPR